MSVAQLSCSQQPHQLNFEGCRCALCEKLYLKDNNRIVQDVVQDIQSEAYHPQIHKEAFLNLIHEIITWQIYPRKIRFCLPEMCVFSEGNPEYWISKNKDSGPIKTIKKKSKMNMFEIKYFFLEGYLYHHPKVLNLKKSKDEFKQKSRQDCVVAAKYENNVTQLLTLQQIQSLFKSKYKSMKKGLMYLQTIVGAQHSQEYILRIELEDVKLGKCELFEKAKKEARIFCNEIKIIDFQFYSEKAEIEYEKILKAQNIRDYLIYLSLKIILVSSKLKPTIIKQAIFKWVVIGSNEYIWDLRIITTANSTQYWENSVLQALQIKLKKTMSMMDLDKSASDGYAIKREEMSVKARQFSEWLQKSTDNEWKEMKVIRSRLQMLQEQKKRLLESQKQGINHNLLHKSFRVKSIKKRQNQSRQINAQY